MAHFSAFLTLVLLFVDAALVGCAKATGDAVGRAVSRRALLPLVAKDFFTFRGEQARIGIESGTASRTCTSRLEELPDPEIAEKLDRRRDPEPYTQITTTVEDSSSNQLTAATGFDGSNNYVYLLTLTKKGRPLLTETDPAL